MRHLSMLIKRSHPFSDGNTDAAFRSIPRAPIADETFPQSVHLVMPTFLYSIQKPPRSPPDRRSGRANARAGDASRERGGFW